MARLAGIALAVAIGIALTGCSSSGRDSSATPSPAATATATTTPVIFETTSLTYAGVDGTQENLRVEVASTPEQSERGLGYRDALPDDAGMLFDLHETRVPQFWMKGMRFPLDIVWIGEDKRVVSITQDVPAQPGATDAELVRVSPAAAVRYVLEINAGAASRHGLLPGAQLTFDLPPAALE